MTVPTGFPRLPLEFDYETEVHESLDREHGIFFNIFRKRGITPKRGLLVIHGLGEHGGRYQHFPHYLKNHYDLIIAPDLRGHGRSEGRRGHVESFDEYVDGAMLAWDLLGKKVGNKVAPLEGTQSEKDWFGHSMGGLVTLRAFFYRSELAAQRIIISAPLLGLKMKVPILKNIAARLLTKVFGSLQMKAEIDAQQLSHDPNVATAYLHDQLNHSLVTPKLFVGFLEAIEETLEADLRFRGETRLLLQLAGEDAIVDNHPTQKRFESLRLEDKKLITYPGLYHEIYNELTKESVFEDWIKWGFPNAR